MSTRNGQNERRGCWVFRPTKRATRITLDLGDRSCICTYPRSHNLSTPIGSFVLLIPCSVCFSRFRAFVRFVISFVSDSQIRHCSGTFSCQPTGRRLCALSRSSFSTCQDVYHCPIKGMRGRTQTPLCLVRSSSLESLVQKVSSESA